MGAACPANALIYRFPNKVREESVDVTRPLGRLVVQEVRMLPDIHHKHRSKIGYIAYLVLGDPVIGKTARYGLLITDGPPDASHLSYTHEIGLPELIASKAGFDGV